MPAPEPVQPFPEDNCDFVVEVSEIMGHKKRGRRFQVLTLYVNSPAHEAEWKPLCDFVDKDGTITTALHQYIILHDLLPGPH